MYYSKNYAPLIKLGQNFAPYLARERLPTELANRAAGLPCVVVYIGDKDLLSWISGSLSTRRGIVGGKISLLGDTVCSCGFTAHLMEQNLAFAIEDVWVNAKGTEKTQEFLASKRRRNAGAKI